MSDSKLQPFGDIMTVTGKYEKDGKERNRYAKVGTMFSTPHFSRVVIKLDAAPIGGDGWLQVFPKEEAGRPPQNQQTKNDIGF